MNNLKAERTLTAFEMQVLIGTTVSGCNMPPDRVFDLTAAWNRLHSLGLIDRADGLAIATASGEARVISALQSLSTQQPMGEVTATMHKSDTETLFSKGWVPKLLGFSSVPLYAIPN